MHSAIGWITQVWEGQDTFLPTLVDRPMMISRPASRMKVSQPNPNPCGLDNGKIRKGVCCNLCVQ
ncbi:hypothetical protein CIT14_22285 [Virgibacillus profundi]|nr:hypothetical protein CIT14_22285 [Virgibacillus profundi]